MEYLENLQRIAMNSVENPTYEDWLRKVRRWFSKTYSTPILQVEDFEDEYVIIAYYENIFDEMDADERKNKIIELIQTAEDKKKKKVEDAQIDKELEEEMRKELEEIQAKKKNALSSPKQQNAIKPKEVEEPIVFEFSDPALK